MTGEMNMMSMINQMRDDELDYFIERIDRRRAEKQSQEAVSPIAAETKNRNIEEILLSALSKINPPSEESVNLFFAKLKTKLVKKG